MKNVFFKMASAGPSLTLKIYSNVSFELYCTIELEVNIMKR